MSATSSTRPTTTLSILSATIYSVAERYKTKYFVVPKYTSEMVKAQDIAGFAGSILKIVFDIVMAVVVPCLFPSSHAGSTANNYAMSKV